MTGMADSQKSFVIELGMREIVDRTKLWYELEIVDVVSVIKSKTANIELIK